MCVYNHPAHIQVRVGKGRAGVQCIILELHPGHVLVTEQVGLRQAQYMWVMPLDNSFGIISFVHQVTTSLVPVGHFNAMFSSITILVSCKKVNITHCEGGTGELR